MGYLIYETAAFNEGWQAFWTAKRLGECPYVGQKQDQWYAGYAAAEAEAYADEGSLAVILKDHLK